MLPIQFFRGIIGCRNLVGGKIKGSELMSAGLELEITDTPKAVIICYSVK